MRRVSEDVSSVLSLDSVFSHSVSLDFFFRGGRSFLVPFPAMIVEVNVKVVGNRH